MKISRVSLFFFILSFNYLFLRAIAFPLIYDNYGTSGNIYILIVIGILALLFLFLPKAFYNTDFNSEYNKGKIKWLINFLLLLRIILGVGTSVAILQELFFYDYNYLVLLFGILLVVMVISSLKSNEIIQISTLFGIAVIMGYFLFLFNYINIDFSLILHDFDFDIKLILIAIVLCTFFDNLYLFNSNKDGVFLSKRLVIFALLSSFILFSFEYGILALSSGEELFKNNQLVGFQALGIEPVSRHNGNFDFVYILMIGVASIFKFSYFLSIIKDSFNKTPKKLFYVVLFVALFILIILVRELLKLHQMVATYSVIVLFLLGVIMFIWMIKVIISVKKV